ncbi:MAG: prolipoprotein diacylglyceryl transferase [Gammaproteobacteria bacterium]|nr:prolipoprotein diacylglyceryl transferase [Gammaproteobacteria bacterium]
MLVYPHIDPVALQLGPLKVHWYGLMYLVGFALGWGLGRLRAEAKGFGKEEPGDMLFYIALGVIFGGRIGYILFYKFQSFLADPLMLFRVWEGGMSFHGGLLGVILAMAWYARRTNRHFFTVADFVAPLVPPALLAGRIGNFINGELWGRPTELPWGMVFPHVDSLPRHPSMLYEGFLEGIVLFVLLWWFSARPRPRMAVSGLFLLLYGCFRFAVEQVREPDAHLGFIFGGWLSMGMLLSWPMILVGAFFFIMAYRKRQHV